MAAFGMIIGCLGILTAGLALFAPDLPKFRRVK